MILPAAYRHERIHFPVQRRVKCQTMLACIQAANDVLCLLIATTDRATLAVFRKEPKKTWIYKRTFTGALMLTDSCFIHMSAMF
jgi:hypothetical protein